MKDWWQDRPWRMIQTNLREIDMRDIEADQVVADLQAFKANVLMINAAGIIASYPTVLPFHFQSPFLQGDSLQEIIAACHEADIRVIARTDFSKVRRPIYEAQPHWAYVSPQGQIVDYNGDVAVCINGEYQQEYAPRIIEELLTSHDFDGIFFNMGGYQTRDYSGTYYGICHCQNCQRAFEAMYGLPLPDKEDRDDPVFRKYQLFKRRTVAAHKEKITNFIRSLWPDLCVDKDFIHRRGFIRQESNTALERPLPHWQYSASDNTKWAVGSYPEMVSSNTTVDFIDFPYRHVAVSPHQQQLRLVQSLANGGALDYYLIGRLDNHQDRSGFAGIKEIFHYHAAHETSYQNLRSLAPVALLKSGQANLGEFRGWFRFLTEAHHLFDVLLTEVALERPWAQYTAFILPDLQDLSDELAERLDLFVETGGTLIATGQSGFRDEANEPRAAPALKCLGIERVQQVRADMRSSYFKFEDKGGFDRFVESELIFMDGPYVYAHYAAAAKGRLKLIPPHNFGPPERCYYTLETDHPGLVVHPFGQGRAIYIPWEPGALFHRQGYTNTFDFAADVLAGVAELSPAGGNLPPMVEVTWFEDPASGRRLLHLINDSGHFGTSFFAPLSLADLEVAVPQPGKPDSVRSLVSGQPCDYGWQDGWLTIQVAKLGLFEAIEVAS
jgi:hypothetical protein